MDVRSLVLKLGFSVNKTSLKIAEQSIQDLKAKLEEAGVAAEKVGDNVAASAQKAAKATNVQSRLMNSLTKSTKDANDGVSALTGKLNGLLAFAGISFTVGGIVNLIDEWKVIEGQVNNVTKSEKESKAVQNEIYNIASRTRQQYKSTAELYTSVARNAQELKKSTKDVLLFTEDVSNAMLLGGGSAASQEAALVQLGQALGSGVLRGDELNSILEQAPRLAKAIAEGMGTTIGNLRAMGQEGKLTAEDVFKAIRSQSDRLKMELGKMPWTFGQASNKMQNAVGLFFKKFEDQQGVIDTLARSLAKVADYIERIDVSRFIAGFRVIAIYAASLFAVSRWGAMVAMAMRFWKTLLAIRNAFLMVMGVQIAFQSQTSKMAALQMLAMGKFLLIAAVVAIAVLAIQDFYKWVTDPTADSMMKRWFGDFETAKDKANDFLEALEKSPLRFLPFITWIWFAMELIRDLYRWFTGGDSVIGSALTGWSEKWQNFCDFFSSIWQSASEAFAYFCEHNVIEMIRDAWNWLCRLSDKIAEVVGSWGKSLKEKFGGSLWADPKGDIANFIQQGVHGQGPTAPSEVAGRYGVGLTPTSTTSFNNSGNQQNTFYITTNGSAEATAKAVGNVIGRNRGGIGGDISNTYPAV